MTTAVLGLPPSQQLAVLVIVALGGLLFVRPRLFATELGGSAADAGAGDRELPAHWAARLVRLAGLVAVLAGLAVWWLLATQS